jgi:hypothetical protein
VAEDSPQKPIFFLKIVVTSFHSQSLEVTAPRGRRDKVCAAG